MGSIIINWWCSTTRYCITYISPPLTPLDSTILMYFMCVDNRYSIQLKLKNVGLVMTAGSGRRNAPEDYNGSEEKCDKGRNKLYAFPAWFSFFPLPGAWQPLFHFDLSYNASRLLPHILSLETKRSLFSFTLAIKSV